MTSAFSWLLELVPKLAGLWNWLSTPMEAIGIPPIAIISTGVLTTLLVIALVRG